MENLSSVMQRYKLKIQQAAKANGIEIETITETPKQRQERKHREEIATTAGLKKRKIRELYKMSLWPADIPLHFTFKDWKPEMQPNVQKAKDIGNQAYILAKRLEHGPFNVIMLGEAGTGKTSLALAIMDDLRKKGQSAMFVSTTELQDLYSGAMELKDVKELLLNTKRAMKEADVLVLDDFGTEGGLDSRMVRRDMQSGIYQVSNARIGKTTILTTNNSPRELAKMYDRKIISRLLPKHKEQQLLFSDMKDVRKV